MIQFAQSEKKDMPLYEYVCRSCQSKATLYQLTYSQPTPVCPKCGANTLQRTFSTFSVRKTYKDVYEDILTDNNLTRGMMNNDPRALAEWNKRMSQGEPVAPEYEEMVEKMNKGEMPSPDMTGNEYPGDKF